MSGCIRTTAGVKIVCYLDSRLVFYDSDDFKSHRPAWIHDLNKALLGLDFRPRRSQTRQKRFTLNKGIHEASDSIHPVSTQNRRRARASLAQQRGCD